MFTNIFKNFDQDHSGTIDKKEMISFIKTLGFKQKPVDK